MVCKNADMIKDSLNWNDLRFFIEVARNGRLLTAAKRLGVNHTTVSRRITALENALEVKLFEQADDGFHLTEMGENLLPLAQQMEGISELTKERVQLSGQSLSGTIRIGAPDGFGNSFLADQITKFITDNPDLTIELLPVPMTHNLQKREVDLYITFGPSKSDNVVSTKITDYKLNLYTSKIFAEANQVDLCSVDDIVKCPFAGYITDILYSDELNFNKHISASLHSQFQSSTFFAQKQFVVNGGGFGVLPHYLAHQDDRLIPVLTDRFSFIRSYWLHTPVEYRRLASVRSFEKVILNKARENKAVFMAN